MSSKKKQEIVALIEKDKVALLRDWKYAKISYDKCNGSRTVKEKILRNDLQREYTLKIMGVALDNYHSNFFLHEERNLIIGETFSEFSDFLHWWLKDVGINGDEWNKLENNFHRIRNKHPDEFEKYSKYSSINNPHSPNYNKK